MEDLLESDSGAGQEFMTGDDLAIPRLGIVQSLSPQRQKTKSDYIEGASEGMIFENVNKKLYPGDQGIVVIPLQYQMTYLEFKDNRGGFVKNHGRDRTAFDRATVRDKDGKRMTAEGNIVSQHAEYFVFMVDEKTGNYAPALLSLSGTQIKHAKRWNSMINQLKAEVKGKLISTPIFYQAYHLTTVPENNDQGEWFRWEIASLFPTFTLPNGKDLYLAARAFRESIVKGAVKVADPMQDSAPESSGPASDDDPM